MSHAFINTKGDYMLELHDEILIEANAVAKLEQERIIAIIERCPRADDGYMILCDARHLIALIEGKQQ